MAAREGHSAVGQVLVDAQNNLASEVVGADALTGRAEHQG